ncbi:helix-turn-helix domain-containing protein [Thiorhodospira sibirica]|uniref:helix-turn-helix domain-containing protein n=1 Tax=Thiorhodospira sibirica TaxID=154347 RepID=UPI00022C0599|nr:helix-turn-helix domain-containing protein [Thiorhodospira sibirica]
MIQQIDAFAGDAALLQAAGFNDQVYRLLAMALQPEVFLKQTDYLAAQRVDTLAAFERYVEEHLQKPVALTEIERMLGVSARALQYACLKRHGCSPMAYIRNRKLDYSYQYLLQSQNDINLAKLSAELYFSIQSKFSRYFRERYGVLPSEFMASRSQKK